MPDGAAALWLAVVGLGIYHGLNPAMGWPLAVANGLTERRGAAVFATLLPLATGHLLAMAIALVPFALIAGYLQWSRELRIGAGALVLGFGVYRLVQRRHARFMARVRPTQLVLWSFLMANAHGAGLMLLPVAVGLCAPGTMAPAGSGVAGALAVALVHTLAMGLSGVAIAWCVYRWLGLRFVRQAWLQLDAVWAASLVVTGAAGIALAW
jgi:hypothetical protein